MRSSKHCIQQHINWSPLSRDVPFLHDNHAVITLAYVVAYVTNYGSLLCITKHISFTIQYTSKEYGGMLRIHGRLPFPQIITLNILNLLLILTEDKFLEIELHAKRKIKMLVTFFLFPFFLSPYLLSSLLLSPVFPVAALPCPPEANSFF